LSDIEKGGWAVKQSVRLKVLEDQRIKAAPIEEKEQGGHKDEGEGKELVDQFGLMIEMHEDQGDESSFDRGEDHADDDILAMSGEFNRREPDRKDGADGKYTTDPKDLADGFFDFFGAVSHDVVGVKVAKN
jgi:hypothetical protein